jgi:hypothetical protein
MAGAGKPNEIRTAEFPTLSDLGDDIRECYQRAEDCARRAKAESDPELRKDFLTMERRWLFLAHSYEFTQRLSASSRDAKAETRRAS